MLQTNALRYYGSAIQKFIDIVAEDPDKVAGAVKKAQTQFLQEHVPAGASGQVSRVARRFALIGTAGTLATAIGILTWRDDDASFAAGSCFLSWLQSRGNASDLDIEHAVEQAQKFFQLHGASRFAEMTDSDAGAAELN